MRTKRLMVAGAALALVTGGVAACGGDEGGSTSSGGGGGGGDDVKVGLITKTETNPFFVKMKEGAQAAAAKSGVDLRTFAGKSDGDNESQVQAIENLI